MLSWFRFRKHRQNPFSQSGVMSTSSSCSLAIVGDGSVGKSSIVESFRTNGFLSKYKQTIGFDVYEKKLTIRDDINVTLYVWDIGGQSIHSKNLDKYLGTADAIFIVYDVTNEESFLNVEDWLRNVRKYSKAKFIYLVGNKVDLLSLRQVSEDDQKKFVEQKNLAGGLFLSARTGDNVVKSFYRIAGESVGIKLTQHELAAFDKVLTAIIQTSNDSTEGRTSMADEIEAEDLAAEKRKHDQCACIIA
jgi:small GTP-binding protein